MKPALSMFKGVDVKSIGSFFTAIGGFVLELAGNSLVSKFTGGIHLSELGTALTDFAYNSVAFLPLFQDYQLMDLVMLNYYFSL